MEQMINVPCKGCGKIKKMPKSYQGKIGKIEKITGYKWACEPGKSHMSFGQFFLCPDCVKTYSHD